MSYYFTYFTAMFLQYLHPLRKCVLVQSILIQKRIIESISIAKSPNRGSIILFVRRTCDKFYNLVELAYLSQHLLVFFVDFCFFLVFYGCNWLSLPRKFFVYNNWLLPLIVFILDWIAILIISNRTKPTVNKAKAVIMIDRILPSFLFKHNCEA